MRYEGRVSMNLKKIIMNFLLVVLLIICSYFFLDARVALFVSRTWMSNTHVAIYSCSYPRFFIPPSLYHYWYCMDCISLPCS